MKKIKSITFYMMAFSMLTLLSCNKNDNSCYDEQLYQQHKNDNCPHDCPGVTGCDGKTYCNECEASRQGIRIL